MNSAGVFTVCSGSSHKTETMLNKTRLLPCMLALSWLPNPSTAGHYICMYIYNPVIHRGNTIYYPREVTSFRDAWAASEGAGATSLGIDGALAPALA